MARGTLPGIGAAAPGFRLPALDGGEWTLESATQSGPALLAFFKVSCPTCQLALPFLERLRGKGLTLFTVCQNDADAAAEFNADFDLTIPTLLDSADAGYPASNAYGITHVPSLFLIDTDRSVAWSSVGFLKQDLEELGRKFGVTLFTAQDRVPDWKGG